MHPRICLSACHHPTPVADSTPSSVPCLHDTPSPPSIPTTIPCMQNASLAAIVDEYHDLHPPEFLIRTCTRQEAHLRLGAGHACYQEVLPHRDCQLGHHDHPANLNPLRPPIKHPSDTCTKQGTKTGMTVYTTATGRRKCMLKPAVTKSRLKLQTCRGHEEGMQVVAGEERDRPPPASLSENC